MASRLLKARGGEVGRSPVEVDLMPTARAILQQAAAAQVEIILPEDAVAATYPGHTRPGTFPVDRIPAATRSLALGQLPGRGVRVGPGVCCAAAQPPPVQPGGS